MLKGFVSLSQIAQDQTHCVIARAVLRKYLYPFSEMRDGGRPGACGGLDPAQPVMRLRDGGVSLDDGFIKRPALEPLTGGQQGVGESELRRKIIGSPADGLFENSRRIALFP